MGDLRGEVGADAGDAASQDRDLPGQVGVLEPVVQAAAFECVVHFAGAVGGEHHQRRCRRPHLAEFWDGDRVLVQYLQQERLEFVVGAVDLVDEQHAGGFGERPQQGSGQKEPLGVQRAFDGVGLEQAGARRLERPQVQQLPREVPVVERLRGVNALMTLQADQRQVERLRQRGRERRLAGAGFTLAEQRPSHTYGEERGHRDAVVGEVARGVERPRQFRRRTDRRCGIPHPREPR